MASDSTLSDSNVRSALGLVGCVHPWYSLSKYSTSHCCPCSDLCVTFGESMLPYLQSGFAIKLVQLGMPVCMGWSHISGHRLYTGLESEEKQTKMTVKWCRKEIRKIMCA